MSFGLNFYLIYTTFFTLCSGFVLISYAAGPSGNFPAGEASIYQWKSLVILNEINGNSKDIGFLINGQIKVDSLWEEDGQKILKIELIDPKLQMQSKVPQSTEYSNLNLYKNSPFIIVLKNGLVKKLFFNKEESIALKNIKRGIASLFQIPFVEEISEIDASGKCNVTYTRDLNKKKIKSNCLHDDLESRKHLDEILGTKILSERINEYASDDSGKILKSIISKENHKIFLQAKQQLGSIIIAEQTLFHENTHNAQKINAQTLETALIEVVDQNSVEATLITETENVLIKQNFNKEVGILREQLKTENLGSIKSAKAFLSLLNIARITSSEDILKALSSKKNKNILFQLYDILGYTQTQNSHKAVMKNLHLDSEEHIDQIERYLWALSFSTHPNIEIIDDLLNKYKKYTNIPDKVRDTLILSLASMARTLSAKKHDYETLKILRTVEETIINGLDYAKDTNRYVFLNALKNLQSPSTIPKLIEILQNGSLKEEVLAWRALKTFGQRFWTFQLLKLAEKTLYQLDKKHDTSSRAIAVDLLLGAKPTEATLENLLHFVASNKTNFEIQQYVFQSIKMLADKCEIFNKKIKNIIKNSKILNNYSALAPRGLSTALTRNIFNGASVNGSLVSIQEIKSGIVKRGVVDVVLDKNGISKELFTLGIFAGGLSSFTSSNTEEDEESSYAGMELTVLGTQIRPFVFFEGNGELMGHVWSGTASEITPAFQALILTQDHEEYLRLGNGFLVQINLKGAVSFDLSGKIEVSIWNRNAQSLIKKSVGYVSKGLIKLETNFVKVQVEFEGSIEPKLNLEIDADFSNNVKLCMRLSQPNSIFQHSVSKLESIPNSKYENKFALNRKTEIPGVSYALNKKNNEMCSEIFS